MMKRVRPPLTPLRGGPFQVPFGQFQVPLRAFQGRIIGRRYYLLPTNFAFGTWVARLIAAPLNQRATTSEWTALNDFEKLEMKRYVILPFPHSSEALWGPQYCRYLASALPKNQEFSGAPRFYLPIRGQFQSPSGVPRAPRGRSRWFQEPGGAFQEVSGGFKFQRGFRWFQLPQRGVPFALKSRSEACGVPGALRGDGDTISCQRTIRAKTNF